jgi:hypothetical protein
MFGKMAADALGISDIGTVISPQDYNKVDADDYILHEEGERIYFLIKSKADEYCFTNLALLHVDGASAMNKKRLLRRYPYHTHPVGDVFLETAGNMDMDVEIKFGIGGKGYSIDIHKKFLTQTKDLYKALFRIAEIQRANAVALENATVSLNLAATTLGRGASAGNTADTFRELTQAAFDWLSKARATYVRKDFGEVFELFIRAPDKPAT